MRLLVIRHGQATANVGLRYLGSRDDPLTPNGQWQAEQLAAACADLPLAAVYTSPLIRAHDTARAIAGPLGLAAVVDARLREGSFGDWEGLSRSEVLARGPEERRLLERWEQDPATAPPGGESLASVQARALDLVAELEGRHPEAWVALVSHVSPIKALLCAALGVPLTTSRRMFLDNATISVIDWGSAPVVRLFNAHGHLGWRSAPWM